MNWYVAKVFYNRIQPLIQTIKEDNVEFFAPTDVIASLLFLHCDEDYIDRFATDNFQSVWVYRKAGSREPAMIRDHEMEVFRFVVTAGHEGLELLGDDHPKYHEGDLVQVIDGPFKGAEGHIKRIKRDRRLVITIPGVVAVATTYIHPNLLRKIETE